MNDEVNKIIQSISDFYKLDNALKYYLDRHKAQILLDCITNLQEEVEDLREDNYAYHQLIRMENKREYRSKFLKEFQEEFGTNTFPDYDEIYKRYDKLKKENKQLKERIDKAIEYLNQREEDNMCCSVCSVMSDELLEILKGDEK